MSAITGIFYRNGCDVNYDQIKKMNDSVSHRGKDGSGVWVEGSVALGHQMLHTTQESLHEKLPFKDETSGMVITADARIDNRAELASILKLENNENVPDSTFILKAYQKWGEKCPEKLLGDFAFAIWDPDKEELFCARDHMGVKPFYYHLTDTLFLFSTEIKALFCHPDTPCNLNELKSAIHLMNIDDREFTFYENISTLKPAHFLGLTRQKSNFQCYWKLDPEYQVNLDSDEEYYSAFLDIFTEAVKCRLRSAFPIGFDLSGGLDSSSVVCMSKEINDRSNNSKEINTFSVVFDEISESDESRYINKIIEKGGINPHFINGDQIDPLKNMKSILRQVEQPFYTPNLALLWQTYETMHQNDIRILLTGHGGDQFVSYGQNYFIDLAVNFQWKKLISEIICYSKVSRKSKHIIFFQKVFMSVIFYLLPRYFLKWYHRLFSKRTFILDRDFSKRVKADQYLEENYWTPLKEASTSKKYHYYLINYPHQNALELFNISTESFFIESRYPFYDKRLIEFCYGLPTDLKYRFGWNRFIERMAMENILPKEIQWRHGKTGYDPVHRRNLLLFEKDFLEKMIFENNSLLKDFIDLDKLKDTYENFKSGSNVDGSSYVWLVVVFYLWLQENKFSKIV